MGTHGVVRGGWGRQANERVASETLVGAERRAEGAAAGGREAEEMVK